MSAGRPLAIDIVGGGPGGLFLARLIGLTNPSVRVRVHERNGPDEAFGFGIVFSDRTMSSFEAADPQTYALIQQASFAWSDMELRLPSRRLRYGGYGFTAIARRRLLHILQRQAAEVGAELCFHSALVVEGADRDPRRVTVLADGAHSANRDAARFGTTVRPGTARYVWFGTHAPFDAVTFPFVRTDEGSFAAHAYPYGDGLSTFIVETDEETWHRAGMDVSAATSEQPGVTDEHARLRLAEVFAEHLGGRPLIGNGSRWASFTVVRNARWSAGNVVLLGDAAHTAHFSVGSGTKLAVEDAIALAGALTQADSTAAAFAAYEAARRPPVERTQALAERSMRWWETFGRRLHLPPHQFGLHFITRTPAIDFAGLSRRHPDRIAEAEAELTGGRAGEHALAHPVVLGPLRLRNRIAVRGRPQPGAALALVGPDAARPASVADAPAPGPDVALGLIVDATMAAGEIQRHVHATGARLVAVATDELDASTMDAARKAGEGIAVCAAIACPPGEVWSGAGDTFVAQAGHLAALGVSGLYLRDPGLGWDHVLAWADRVRTETGLPILLDGPAGWALSVRRRAAVDDWPTRLHVAVVSGRVDVVVAAPFPPATGESTRTHD